MLSTALTCGLVCIPTEIVTSDGRVTGVRLWRRHADRGVRGGGRYRCYAERQPGAGMRSGCVRRILVDAALRTSDPDIFAVPRLMHRQTPCIRRWGADPGWSTGLRLNQPANGGRRDVGNDASYDELPYFYTDQTTPGWSIWVRRTGVTTGWCFGRCGRPRVHRVLAVVGCAGCWPG